MQPQIKNHLKALFRKKEMIYQRLILSKENVNEPQEHFEPGKNNVSSETNENKQLTENWCRLDVSNILPGRTRSQ